MFRILLAQKSELNNRIVKSALSGKAAEIGFIEVPATKGDILKNIEMVKPDILVISYELNDGDCISVIENIKRFEETGINKLERKVHIVVIGENDSFDIVREVFRLGVEDYILDPPGIYTIIEITEKIMAKVLSTRLENLYSSVAERKETDYNILSEYTFFYNVMFNDRDMKDHMGVYELFDIWEYGYIATFNMKLKSVGKDFNIFEFQKMLRNKLSRKMDIKWGPIMNNKMSVYVKSEGEYLNDRVKMNNFLHWSTKEILDVIQTTIETASVGVGRVYSKEKLHFSYEESVKALMRNEALEIKIYDEEKDKEITQAMGTGNNFDRIIRSIEMYLMDLPTREIRLSALKMIYGVIKIDLESKEKKLSEGVAFAVEYIYANYKKEITLKEVAKLCGVSTQYLSKIFGEELGINFIDYLNNFRVNKAKEMLAENKKSVKEICFEVGYNDPNYFSRTFKKVTGRTPREYIKEMEKI